ncbi:DUF2062 domain-containing protein [Synoicihabitans lomoniglobus]|uniref:DUF2062 domain-containing protein n=1 Tax=Synoicihabitans lomoniglobus TaxID=2909285 RepID=A0AAF0A033_9BACT|nr:DUF2062 domain-containing protein [Opitutaceae bacterium LMO-M01]WED63952.1 DUF2062 domain-containing protein [Opitutaceae bacterium LMO-M01]
MSSPAVTTADSNAAPRPSFWQRRVVAPIVKQLTQGVTPDRISFTLGIGTVCSLFPFLGFTWLLNLVVGVPLRLNQPIMQTFNQLLTPIHLPLILIYVRGGELIWGAQAEPFSVVEMVQNFADLSLGEFIHKFGWAGAHAFTAWLLTAPLLFAMVYYPLRPVIRRLARRTTGELQP